jgi:hypothetical protein
MSDMQRVKEELFERHRVHEVIRGIVRDALAAHRVEHHSAIVTFNAPAVVICTCGHVYGAELSDQSLVLDHVSGKIEEALRT